MNSVYLVLSQLCLGVALLDYSTAALLGFGGTLWLVQLLQWQQPSQFKPVSLVKMNGLAIIVSLLLAIEFSKLDTLRLMLHLLWFAAGLRLIGLQSNRDLFQVIWVHLALVAGCMLLQQQFAFALLLSSVVVLDTFGLFSWINPTKKPATRPMISLALGGLLVSICCFLLVPRLPPFWQLPGPQQAKTGLSDKLSPGGIDELLQDERLAFRVSFADERQFYRQDLYFRLRIYDYFDGENWLTTQDSLIAPTRQTAAKGAHSYQLLLEPNSQMQVPTLGDVLSVSPVDVSQTAQGLLRSSKPITQRSAFHVQSTELVRGQEPQLKPYLQLSVGNPQARQLALAWQGLSALQVRQQIQTLLSQGGYSYQTNPGRLSGEQIDQFLFSTKAGFCAHYASASSFLFRAAGIPARIVGGYLGGEWQPNGEYLSVRQSDAHAWVEYYDGIIWQRFDPTLLVHQGLWFDRNQPTPLFGLSADFWTSGSFGGLLLQSVRDLDYYWTLKVLGFQAQDQQQLWQDWLDTLWQQSLWFAFVVFSIASISWALYRIRQYRRQPVSQWLMAGLWRYKQPSETVSECLHRLQRLQPELASEFQRLQTIYAQMMYAETHEDGKECRQLASKLARQLQ